MVPHAGLVPRPSTSFIGRLDDVSAVVRLARGHRVVTVVGPGGAGKTRLAIETAGGPGAASWSRVCWVELADLAEPSAVPHAVGRALGALIDPRQDPARSLTRHLARHLAGRSVLLCLDNAEHLVEAVADLVAAVVDSCPRVTVLVTSREPLGVQGEVVWRVPPMADDEAVELFVQRAAAVRAAYRPDAVESDAILRIVRHLDGIPLALELAAAWLGTLSPQQVLAALDDRFRLLVRGPRNAQRRHQTLASSIGWSHGLLSEVDRATFRRVSVFAGSFSLEAAVGVVTGSPVDEQEALHSLARLVDKSLVVAEHLECSPRGDGATRFRMLETIRAFAAARLRESGEEETTGRRHLRWYADLAAAANDEREHGAGPDGWRVALQQEYADLRAALDRGLRGEARDVEAVRGLAADLAFLWHEDRRGPEGLGYLRRAIALRPGDRTVAQARLLAGLALVADTASPLDVEYDAALEAHALATEVGEDRLQALCLSLAAVGASYTDFDRAWELAERAAAAAPDDEFTQASARALQAIVLHHRDRHDDAQALFAAVVPRLLRLHRGIASTAMAFQASSALATADVTRARRIAQDAVAVADPLGDHLRVGIARSALAVVHARTGRSHEAETVLEPLLHLAGPPGEVFVTGLAHALGTVAATQGRTEKAVEWFRRDATATDDGVDSWIAAISSAELGRMLVRAGDVDEAGRVLDRAATAAQRLGMPGVLAIVHRARADLAAAGPDAGQAALEHAHDSLALSAEHRLCAALPGALETVARHTDARRTDGTGLRLASAAAAARDRLGLARDADEEDRWSSYLEQVRSTLDGATFERAWTEGETLSLDDAVALARRARGSRGRPPSGWPSLTPTELQVTTLVAEGLSNPEIAARLMMGRGTVKTHLSHIFAKVGVGNRTELATLAVARLPEPS